MQNEWNVLSVTASARSASDSPRSRGRRDHAMFHFRRGLVGKRQAQDFRAGKLRLCVEQIADALGDDARLSRARAGHHHQRTLAVMHGGALLRIELNSRRGSAGVFKKISHVGSLSTLAYAASRKC